MLVRPFFLLVLSLSRWAIKRDKKAHSLTNHPFRFHAPIDALFTHLTFPDSSTSDPEVYPRPDGSVYLCGSTSSDPLPTLASDVEPDEEAVEALVYQAGCVSPFLREGGEEGGEVEGRQACFLPSAERGRPLVGKVRGVKDVWCVLLLYLCPLFSPCDQLTNGRTTLFIGCKDRSGTELLGDHTRSRNGQAAGRGDFGGEDVQCRRQKTRSLILHPLPLCPTSFSLSIRVFL